MNFLKRFGLISFLSVFLFVFGVNFVESSADPLAEVASSVALDDSGEMLGAVLAPEIVIPIALALTAAGVAWHNRTQLEKVCSYIGNNVKGAYILGAGKCSVDIQKVVGAFNNMCKTHIVNSSPIHFSNFDAELISYPNGVPFYSSVTGCPIVLIGRQVFSPISNGYNPRTLVVKDSNFMINIASSVDWSSYNLSNVNFSFNDEGTNVPFSALSSNSVIGVGWDGQGDFGDGVSCTNPDVVPTYSDVISLGGGCTEQVLYAQIKPPSVAPSVTTPRESVNVSMPSVYKPVSVGSGFNTLTVPVDSNVIKNGTGGLVGDGVGALDKSGALGGVVVGDGTRTIPIPQTGIGSGDIAGTGTTTGTGTATGAGTATGTGVVSDVLDGLKDLFIPQEGFLTGDIACVSKVMDNKFGLNSFMIPFKHMGDLKSYRFPNITVHMFGQTETIVSFDTFYKFLTVFRYLLEGFMFFLLVIYNINRIYNLIRKDTFSHASTNLLNNALGNGDGKK